MCVCLLQFGQPACTCMCPSWYKYQFGCRNQVLLCQWAIDSLLLPKSLLLWLYNSTSISSQSLVICWPPWQTLVHHLHSLHNHLSLADHLDYMLVHHLNSLCNHSSLADHLDYMLVNHLNSLCNHSSLAADPLDWTFQIHDPHHLQWVLLAFWMDPSNKFKQFSMCGNATQHDFCLQPAFHSWSLAAHQ